MSVFFDIPDEIPKSYLAWKTKSIEGLEHHYRGNSSKKNSGVGSRASGSNLRWPGIQSIGPFLKKQSQNHLSYDRQSFKTRCKRLFIQGSWIVFSILVARLYFMKDGVAEFRQMKLRIAEENTLLEQSKRNVTRLQKEIGLLKTDKSYQRVMAKEHLGVIAQDEYLVILE